MRRRERARVGSFGSERDGGKTARCRGQGVRSRRCAKGPAADGGHSRCVRSRICARHRAPAAGDRESHVNSADRIAALVAHDHGGQFRDLRARRGDGRRRRVGGNARSGSTRSGGIAAG